MATSFATPTDLARRLGVTFTPDETTQAEVLLEDATAWLQGQIGQLIVAGTATFTSQVPYAQTWLDLPQQPVTAVDEVTIGGEPVTDFHLIDGRLWLPSGHGGDRFSILDGAPRSYREVTVTFSYGFATVPQELVSWCCVLASQARSMVGHVGTLGGSAVRSQSRSIDGYSRSTTYTDGANAYDIPERALEQLRARYGAGAYITGR